MMHSAWPGATFESMQAVRRVVDGDPGVIVDAALGIAAAGLITVAAWGSPRLIGSEAIAGPAWLLALLPLLLGGSLLLRRRAPLVMWLTIWGCIGLLSLLADNLLRGLAWMFVVFAAAYSLGAHASLRRTVAGLVLAAPVVVVLSHRGELALAFSQGEAGGKSAVDLALLQLVAFWLAGVLVHARKRAATGKS